jgi:hypothetical protein
MVKQSSVIGSPVRIGGRQEGNDSEPQGQFAGPRRRSLCSRPSGMMTSAHTTPVSVPPNFTRVVKQMASPNKTYARLLEKINS